MQLKASDKDGDTKLEYKIVRVTNNGKRIFKLNPRNGKLDLIGPVKAGEHYAITVEVIDSGEKSSQGKILRIVQASYRFIFHPYPAVTYATAEHQGRLF